MSIKLGKLSKQAINLKFPHCWISLAAILGLEYRYEEKRKLISIEVGLNDVTIHEDNSVVSEVPLTKEIIASIIVEAAKQKPEEN